MPRVAAHLPLTLPLNPGRGTTVARPRRSGAGRPRDAQAVGAARDIEVPVSPEISGPGGWLDSSYILRDGLSVVELESLDAWLEAQHVP